MKISVGNRLSFRLARNTVILAVLLGMTMSFIQVVMDYVEQIQSLDNDIRAIIRISHAPASQISYNIDARLASELLEGLLEHPAIIHAEIIDTDNRVLASKSQPAAESPYRWLSDLLFQPTRTYTEALFVPQLSDFVLGDLNVVVDTHPGGALYLQRATFTLLSGFLRSLILSAVLLILFYIMLTKPLLRVIASVSEVDPETPEKVRLPVPQGHEFDEIGVLVNSTNNQLQAIDGSLEKLRRAESRLKTYSEQLEQIVDSRTRELSEKNKQLIKSNQDLRIAKEEAVKRAKARADFLANMSHEIRTPFNGVLGMISLTLEEPLSAKQKEHLNIAYSSGVSLLELLNDILDISKVEAGKLTLENISFDLRKSIEDVIMLMAQNAHAKNIDIYAMVTPTFPERVFGDPTRTRQIVSNLVGNAIKFTEKGCVSVKLLMHNEQNMELQVLDTGIGIERSQLDTIFSPFAQADTQTTRKFGGTGLGLTLCRQLVSHMGGTLSVESEPGKGSLFKVILPLVANLKENLFKPNEKLLDFNYLLINQAENQTFISISNEIENCGFNHQSVTYEEADNLSLDEINCTKDTIILFDSEDINPIIQKLPASQHVTSILVSPRNILNQDELISDLNISQIISAPVSRDRLFDALCNAINVPVKDTHHKLPAQIAEPGQKVLLVEDNQVNQLVAKTILTKLGYEVSIAPNGKEAVDMIKNMDYDIVLMDCHMPVMDGYEATRAIRQNPRFDKLPIVAVTANVMQGDKEKCISCGMNDYLTKPYEKKALVALLQKWLSGKSPLDHSESAPETHQGA